MTNEIAQSKMEKKTIKDLRIEDSIYTIMHGDLKEAKVTTLEYRGNDGIYLQIGGRYGENFCIPDKNATIIKRGDFNYYLNKIDAYIDYIVEIEKAIKRDSDEMVKLVYKIRQNEQLLKAVKYSVEQYSIR